MEKPYKIIEIELGLIYDLLYTKAKVMHTRWGIARRIIRIFLTLFMLVMVSLDKMLMVSKKHHNYSFKIDLTITIVLLGFAFLELYAVVELLLSDQTAHWLITHKKARVLQAINCVRNLPLKRRMSRNESSEIKQVEQSSSDKTDSSVKEKENEKEKEKEIAARKGGRTRPSLNFLSILKDENIEIDTSCPHKLCNQLYTGVYLKPNTLKFFVDEKSNNNCFVVFARKLTIMHSGTPEYWKWTKVKETSGEEIEVAELLNVCWLEVGGKINTIDLSPGALYEIVFVVKMSKYTDEGHISKCTLQLTIIPPRAKRISRTESLQKKPIGHWFEILVGEFIMSPENVGFMDMSLEDLSPKWKNGLVLKCAIIRPKKE